MSYANTSFFHPENVISSVALMYLHKTVLKNLFISVACNNKEIETDVDMEKGKINFTFKLQKFELKI